MTCHIANQQQEEEIGPTARTTGSTPSSLDLSTVSSNVSKRLHCLHSPLPNTDESATYNDVKPWEFCESELFLNQPGTAEQGGFYWDPAKGLVGVPASPFASR